MKLKTIIVWLIIVVSVVGIVVAVNAMYATEVNTFKVESGKMTESIKVKGIVQSEQTENIYSRFSSRIKQINVQEGDTIKPGSELIKFDTNDVDTQLKKANNTYDSSTASFGELKQSIKPEQIKQAEVNLEQARVALEYAKKEYDIKNKKLSTTEELFKTGAVSEQDLNDMRSELLNTKNAIDIAGLNYKSAQYNLSLLKKGASQTAIDVAKLNISQAKIQIDELMNAKQKATVLSDVAGVVLEKFVENGQYVEMGQKLFSVSNTSSAYIKVDVLVGDAIKLQKGQKVLITGNALKSESVPSEIYYISPKAHSVTSSLGVEQQKVEVRIKFDNAKYKLRPGYDVDVSIILDEKEKTLMIPQKAIYKSNGKENVLLMVNNKVEMREVKTGIENESNIEIIEGLKGDEVVIEPTNDLELGSRVKKKS